MEKDEKCPLVTIWCTTYNHGPYIRQCLEGFVIQKTQFRFEAIVHDDCSTDETALIIREYAEKYPDIIKPIFETENQFSKKDGSLDNILLSATRGKYVAICEGDDYWSDPFKLEIQIEFMESHKDYSMCYHNAVVFYENSIKKPYVFCKKNENGDVCLSEIISDWIIPTASIVVRTSIFPMPDWKNRIYSGDMTMALIAYAKGKIYYINRVMSFYRKSDAGLSSTSITPPEFVCSQKALLYDYYNKETGRKYDAALTTKIRYYNSAAKWWSYRKISVLYAILRMPLFSFSKFLKRHS